MKVQSGLAIPDIPVAGGRAPRSASFGILSTYPPTRCGLATFSFALGNALHASGSAVNVVRVADGLPSEHTRVVGEVAHGSPSVAADLLSHNDIALIQHDFDIFGGSEGAEVLDIVEGLCVPSVVVLHSVPEQPSGQRRWLLRELTAAADHVVVLSEAARQRLRGFDVQDRKVSVIPHGLTVPRGTLMKRGGRPTVLTWGLLRPGKGVERVVEAMGSLRQLSGRPRFLIAGPTHPRVLAVQGEAYRDACVEQARRLGVADSVHFDAGYRSGQSLTELMLSAGVVVLPFDSIDQVNSGVLANTIACGRPVIATAFPHAVELLSGGAGIVVKHGDPEALQAALEAVLTQPRLAGSMAAEARRLAPAMSWSIAASAYQTLAQRILHTNRQRPR